jgi:ParB/RepB/Spo0J family partition protein
MNITDTPQRVKAYGSATGDVVERVELIPIDLIDPNPRQHRRVFTNLVELSGNIKEKGVLVPIRLLRRGERYRIVYGERRWRAARAAGLLRIPAIVTEADLEDIDEVSLVENEQRESLNTIDHAMAVREFSKRGYSNKDIAMLIGKSESHISKCSLAGEFLSEAMAGGFLNYNELAGMSPGLERLYVASSYARQTGDLGFGVDLLKHAICSELTRRQMQCEAERRIAALAQEAIEKDGERAEAPVRGDEITGPLQVRQSGKETPVRPSQRIVRRWQITVANRLTSGRMIRILDTLHDMLDALSFIIDGDVKVTHADEAALTEAVGQATRSLSTMSLRMEQLRKRTQGK